MKDEIIYEGGGSYMSTMFDPDDVSQKDMRKLADNIEAYIDILEEIMIIPKDIIDDCKKDIDEALKRTRKLIKKLRNGDRSVFKSSDEIDI